MNPALGPELKQHFDELADEAPPAPDTLVPTARIRGDRHHRRQAVMGAGAGAVALALTVGLGVTQPWSRSTDAPAASPAAPVAAPRNDRREERRGCEGRLTFSADISAFAG